MKILIAKKPENWFALTEGKSYKALEYKSTIRNNEERIIEYLIIDNISMAWYPKCAFCEIEEWRER